MRWHLKREQWILLLLLIAATLGVTTVFTRLSFTADELFHIDCGMEWWNKGTYTKQSLHPPVTRVMGASLIYLMSKPPKPATASERLNPDRYKERLWQARYGTLPFFIISALLVFAWSRRLFGDEAALWSVALYAFTSTVAANGAVATTDMGYTMTLLWALMAGIEWLKSARAWPSIVLGASLGLMAATKFSGLVHWPLAMAFIFAAQVFDNSRRSPFIFPICWKHVVNGFTYVLPTMLLVIGLVYRFDYNAFIDGLVTINRMNQFGYALWLWHPLKEQAVWYFFPVVFFFKTPVAFMIASVIGAWRCKRERLDIEKYFPLIAAAAVMASSMASNINLGVRHVLPLYPLLAIPAGYGVWYLWQKRGILQLAAAALMLWHVQGYIRAWPDHFTYFNEFAGERPERITLDSDYDWGQELYMLDEALQKRGITQVNLCLRKTAMWSARFVLHAQYRGCQRNQTPTGWVVMGRSWALLNNFAWLEGKQAVEKIGTTMDLYYFEPGAP